MQAILLASASSRRKELMQQINLSFEVASMDIDESVLTEERPFDYVQRLAEEKAKAGLAAFPDHIVLAADTTVVLNDVILGKPKDEIEALNMLQQLSGSTHDVLTGVAVAANVAGQATLYSEVVSTKVVFAHLTEDELNAYIKTGEPMGKAGAYGIQGKAAIFVDKIEGSYSNVVGLPLAETARLLAKIGVELW